MLTFSSAILVAVDTLFVADILFVVGEAIQFFTVSMPACGNAIRFLTVSAPACGDAIRYSLFVFWQSQCLLEDCPTILPLCVDGPFFIYFWFYRCVTNRKKDSFKWRKFLYGTHWTISKSLTRNHQIFKSPRLLTLRPLLPDNSQVSVGTNYRSQTTCYNTRAKTIVILQGNQSHKKGLKLTEFLSAQ